MFSQLALLISLIHTSTPDLSPILPNEARPVLTQWFLPDNHDALAVERQLLESDEIGKRYSVSFDTADGGMVSGVLAMPGDTTGPVPVALAFHAMGRTHDDWWNNENPTAGGRITADLRERGYAVIALDARRHGERARDDVGIRQIIERAHAGAGRRYQDMIIGTVRDYRTALIWAGTQDDLATEKMLAVGYSMGAQMALLLASFEPGVATVLAMVPPYVKQFDSPVAPRSHVSSIHSARLLLIGAKDDPYSTTTQYHQVFAAIATPDKKIVMFDGGHVLPPSYLDAATSFLDSLDLSQ